MKLYLQIQFENFGCMFFHRADPSALELTSVIRIFTELGPNDAPRNGLCSCSFFGQCYSIFASRIFYRGSIFSINFMSFQLGFVSKKSSILEFRLYVAFSTFLIFSCFSGLRFSMSLPLCRPIMTCVRILEWRQSSPCNK